MALFRGGGSQPGERLPASSRMSGDGARFRRERRSGGRGRATVLLAAIWLLGLVALGAVVRVRASSRRDPAGAGRDRADAKPAGLAARDRVRPAVAGRGDAPARAASRRLGARPRPKQVIDRSVATLASLGHSHAPARIAALDQRLFRASPTSSPMLVAHGRLGAGGARARRKPAAGRHRGRADRPSSTRADRDYGADAARSRNVAAGRHGRRDPVPAARLLGRLPPLGPGAEVAAIATRRPTR